MAKCDLDLLLPQKRRELVEDKEARRKFLSSLPREALVHALVVMPDLFFNPVVPLLEVHTRQHLALRIQKLMATRDNLLARLRKCGAIQEEADKLVFAPGRSSRLAFKRVCADWSRLLRITRHLTSLCRQTSLSRQRAEMGNPKEDPAGVRPSRPKAVSTAS
jgi:hypothetical protein